MQEISGYKINNQIYENNKTIFYKAVREKDKFPVILKILKKDYSSQEDLTKFKNEYEILNKIRNLSGVIKCHELLEYKNSLIIVMENFNDESLNKIIKKDIINLKSFLELAIDIAVTIGNIHKQQIIHKDIKPYNIVADTKTNRIKIIDFSLSTQITKETQSLINPDKIEGTLAYISPEQTGRMNRSINYRSDYYSMGITFYQMLTGKLPFVSDDPLELIHFHIAKIPQAPCELDKSIPKGLSDIIMKLLSKTAEERYQSINGLLYDLNQCLDLLNKKGKITHFKIGEKDLSDVFQISEKLYGRDVEIKLLIEKFNNVYNGGKEVLFFSGPPGIGKSALVKEIHKTLAEKSGFFIEGKFDQYKKNVPYSAIMQAFSMLAKQILTESDKKIKIWKELILEKVGSIGKIITDEIPEFELIIGKQPEVQELPPTETQNRFNMLIQNFTKVFARENQPLVMFIDDMQWIDDAGMQLLEKTVGDRELHNFLFIGSYRENEVNQSHPLTRIMAKMENRDEISREYIILSPLNKQNTAELLADTFSLDVVKTKELADILIEKTDGNPFFINEFLNTLFDEKLISFENGWQWDVNKIENSEVTINVVELMTNRIKKLDKTTWELIKTAAGFGGKFTLAILSLVYDKDENETFNDLKNAVNEGLILKTGNDYKFVHDRVKEAAISLIGKDELKRIHYKIGMTLLKNTKKENFENTIFDIANHLSCSKSLLNDEEKKELIKINLKAAYRAKESGAFDAALKLLNESKDILLSDMWNNEYALILKYYTELAEAEYLNTNFDNSEKHIDTVLDNTKNELDNVRVHEIKIRILGAKLNIKESIDYGIKILKKFGINIPKNPGNLTAMADIIKAKIKLGKKPPGELINLPELTDPYKIAANEIMLIILPIAFIAGGMYVTPITLKILNLSMKYGNSPASAFGYATFGLIHCGILNNMKTGYEFGELAKKVLKKFNNKYLESQISYLIGGFINHWSEQASKSIEILKKGFSVALENGDLPYAGYNLDDLINLRFILGDNLEIIYNDFSKYINIINKSKDESAINYFYIYLQTIINLQGKSERNILLESNYFNENLMLSKLIKSGSNVCLTAYYHAKIILCYIFEKYDLGLEIVKKGKSSVENAFGKFQLPEFIFYYSLLLSLTINTKNKSKNIAIMKKNSKKLKKWSKYAPQNHLHKYYLVEAEITKHLKKDSKSEKLYEEAIKLSLENEYINITAIANECAAKYYFSKDLPKIARTYLQQARHYYLQWGALAKVKDMEKKYSEFFENQFDDDSFIKNSEASSNSSKPGHLDIETILKSTQAISSEIEMENLLERLIKIAIENAGAQKGFLILTDKNNNLFIEAEGEIDKEKVTVLQSKPIDKSKNISSAVIRYCAKTKENVVLNNASKEGLFISDEYIIKNKTKSILCMPIIKQTKLIGLLYMENNLTSDAFPEERVEILKILSSQTAISIENSRLIDNLKEQERLKQEMVIAEQIQTSLIPIIPEDTDFEIAATIRPTEEVGGDYFDVVFDKAKNLWFAIGDVSGHGVTPGLIMMMAQTAINSNLLGADKAAPSSILEEVNRVLYENIRNRIKKSHYMTLCLMKHLGNGSFIHSGLHLDIIVYRAKTKKCELINTTGVYLGIIADIKKHTADNSFHLDKDDIMVLYTDGIIEAMNEKDQMLGLEGLVSIIEENFDNNSLTLKRIILAKTLEWCSNKVADDITLLVIKRK